MRTNSLFDDELEDELNDNFGEIDDVTKFQDDSEEEAITPIHSDHWTLVDAFNVINEHLGKSQLGKKLLVKCAEAFDFLSETLGFNAVQCTIIAMLIENGQPLSFRQMGKILGITRLSMMTHYDDLEKLFEARWVLHRGARERDGWFEGYGLVEGVVRAIRQNKPFVPENLKCKDTQEFVDRIAQHVFAGFQDDKLLFEDEKHWLMDMINANKKLPICKLALSLKDDRDIAFLMLIIADYSNCNGLHTEGLGPREVQLAYPMETTRNYRFILNMLQNGSHPLFLRNLIEHKCEDGMANTSMYVASKHLKEVVLADYTAPTYGTNKAPLMNGMKKCEDIEPKSLFYNERENQQVERLKNLLTKEQLPLVQERLKEKCLRTGVCILMHGAPGTGKTATAYELARQTGRDIIQVQVTDFKDKFVGESEAKLKGIFNKYRECCQNSEVTPILLLNEGDAILSKRTTNVERSVDQMSNALQNILLEEMENLEGVMIVTTNMTVNLDSAFERRFIFKIQFDKPSKEVKARIWKSMVEELDDNDSMALAEMYDISGGEIENIARKTVMEYAITGQTPDITMIKNFAKEEKLNANSRPVIGFGHCK